MLEDLIIEIVGLGEDIVDKYGHLKAKLEEKGKRLDEFDLLIAATALSLNLILITSDLHHFQRIPELKLGN